MKKANINHLNPSSRKDTMTRALIAMVLSLAPLVVSAGAWTTAWVKVLSVTTPSQPGQGYAFLEPAANNINNCTVFNDTTSMGVPTVIFTFPYSTPPTDAQKAVLAGRRRAGASRLSSSFQLHPLNPIGRAPFRGIDAARDIPMKA